MIRITCSKPAGHLGVRALASTVRQVSPDFWWRNFQWKFWWLLSLFNCKIWICHLMYCEGMFCKPANKIRPEGGIVWVAPRIDCTHLNIFLACQEIWFCKIRKMTNWTHQLDAASHWVAQKARTVAFLSLQLLRHKSNFAGNIGKILIKLGNHLL